MDDWEKLAEEESEPVIKPVVSSNVNKWDGEDEDDVKDSWEDEDEEPKEDDKSDDAQVVKKTKPQKSLTKKIAERERLKQEQEEAKAREREANMTPEEKLAEKLRLQKIQEEADLRAAMDTFGVTDKSSIDGQQPRNKAELTELADSISKKVSQFKHLADFPGFLEELVRNVCANLNSSDLQKIKKTVDNLYAEKQKLEKEQKNKKGSKGKTKVNLRIETDNLGPEGLMQLKKIANDIVSSKKLNEDDDVPELVENFEDVAIKEKTTAEADAIAEGQD